MMGLTQSGCTLICSVMSGVSLLLRLMMMIPPSPKQRQLQSPGQGGRRGIITSMLRRGAQTPGGRGCWLQRAGLEFCINSLCCWCYTDNGRGGSTRLRPGLEGRRGDTHYRYIDLCSEWYCQLVFLFWSCTSRWYSVAVKGLKCWENALECEGVNGTGYSDFHPRAGWKQHQAFQAILTWINWWREAKS